MENSCEFNLCGRCDDQVNGPFGYEYLYWSVPQITSVGSDLNDLIYNSAVYVQPNFQVLYPVISVIDRGTTYFFYPHVYYSNDCVPNTFTYQDLSEGLTYCDGYSAQAGYVNDSWSEGLAYSDGYSDQAGYVNDSWSEGLAYSDGYSDQAGYVNDSWSEGLAYSDGYNDQAGYVNDSWSEELAYSDGYSDQAGYVNVSWSGGLAYCDRHSEEAGYVKGSWSEVLAYCDGYSEKARIYGAVDKGPCYGHFLDEIVGPEITSCYISYAEIPEKLNDAPVHSNGDAYERKGEKHSCYGNGGKKGEGDTSVSSRFKSTLKRVSDLNESDLKEYYFNDIEWLRIPKPEIRYEEESEKYRLYQMLGSLNMSSLKKDLKKNYNRKKRKVYKRACKGQRMKKYQLKELNWVPHQLGSILEKEETESPELTLHESLKKDSKNIENDVVAKEDPRVEPQKPDEDPHRVKVGDIYVRYAPDRYRVFCLENRKKKRLPAVRKFFGRIFSYVKKPN